MSGRFDVLCISPHLDDVALSMAATVRAHVQRGQRVLVASLFTHAGPRDAGPFKRREYPARRAEDERACRMLGASVLHAGLLDAPFRSPVYRDFAGICFARDRRDASDQRGAGAMVRRIVAAARPRRVYAPLGVGEHLDHRLTFDAARDLRGVDLWFYEDRPYAWVRHAVALRLHALGLGAFKAAWMPELAESFRAAPMAAALSEPDLRTMLEGYAAQFAAVPLVGKGRARVITKSLGPDAARFAQRVFECHASQVQGIVGGKGKYAKLALAYAKGLKREDYVERFWRL